MASLPTQLAYVRPAPYATASTTTFRPPPPPPQAVLRTQPKAFYANVAVNPFQQTHFSTQQQQHFRQHQAELSESRKLDEMLARCRQIGASTSSASVISTALAAPLRSSPPVPTASTRPPQLPTTANIVTNKSQMPPSKHSFVVTTTRSNSNNNSNISSSSSVVRSPSKPTKTTLINSKYKLVKSNASAQSSASTTATAAAAAAATTTTTRSTSVYKTSRFKLKKVNSFGNSRDLKHKWSTSVATNSASSSVAVASMPLDINVLLGRRVRNMSRNKFKFISSLSAIEKKQALTKKRREQQQERRRHLLSRMRYVNEEAMKTRRRSLATSAATSVNHAAALVAGGGGVVRIKGIAFKLKNNGKTLSRLASPRLSGAQQSLKYRMPKRTTFTIHIKCAISFYARFFDTNASSKYKLDNKRSQQVLMASNGNSATRLILAARYLLLVFCCCSVRVVSCRVVLFGRVGCARCISNKDDRYE